MKLILILRLFRIKKLLDNKNEVPANFSDYLNMWSFESITCISLNQRLGILNENYHDEYAEKLIKVKKNKITHFHILLKSKFNFPVYKKIL